MTAPPTAPGCQAFHGVLHPYLDEELPPAQRAQARAHLTTCGACAALVQNHRALTSDLRLALVDDLPPGLAARIRARIRWRIIGRRLVATAVAAVLVLAIGVVVLRQDPRRNQLTSDEAQQLVALHHRSLAPDQPTTNHSSDPGHLATWLAGQLPYTPRVADPAGSGYALLGARLDWCDQQRVATIVYRHNVHLLTLICYPTDRPTDIAPIPQIVDGLTICTWVSGPLEYIAVADLSQTEMRRFADLIRNKRAVD